MNITFYTVSKKRNSTRQPSSGTSYTGTLTQASGVVSPTIIMEFGNTAPAYNYAYITEFGRYYWINEITSVGGGLWEVSMSVDVLATYKTAIGSSSKYVLRSASQFDGDITDMKYPTKAGFTMATPQRYQSGFNSNNMDGTYIVGIISPTGGYGSLSIYNMTPAEFSGLKSTLSPATYYQNITDVDLQNLAISVVDPLQYIAWVKYYPAAIARDNQDMETVYLGPATLQACPINKTTFEVNQTFNLTAHPDAATRGDYLSCEPFTHRFLSWLPVGIIHLPSLTAKMSAIRVHIVVDLISGTGDLEITTTEVNESDRKMLYRTAFSIGVDIPIAQIVSGNPLKLVSGGVSLVSAAASALTGNIAGSIASGVSAISDFIGSTIPEVQSFKPGSGALLPDGYFRLCEFFANVVNDDNTEYGRPLCQVKTINTLSGYVLCSDGEVAASGATPSELAEIESYLTGGFFYE